jgi:hypothetical protein
LGIDEHAIRCHVDFSRLHKRIEKSDQGSFPAKWPIHPISSGKQGYKCAQGYDLLDGPGRHPKQHHQPEQPGSKTSE